MEYNLLGRTSFRVSRLGLGGAPLGGDFGPVGDQEVVNVVHRALDFGINFIDTAPLYGSGESERRIGLALKGRRNSVILATKAITRGVPYTYDNTIRSVEESMKRLQTDVIDLLQIHEPSPAVFDQIIHEAVPALMKLKEQGKIRAIGVNGRDLPMLVDFIETGLFDTTQMFSRYMLIDYSSKDVLLPVARKHGVGVINGSVLGMGLISGTPPEFLRKNTAVLAQAEARIKSLAFLSRKEPGGLVEPGMRFSLSNPEIHVTLTGTTSLDMLEENASYCDGQGLPREHIERIFSAVPNEPMIW